MTDSTHPAAVLGGIPPGAARLPRAPWHRRPFTWLAAALATGGLAGRLCPQPYRRQHADRRGRHPGPRRLHANHPNLRPRSADRRIRHDAGRCRRDAADDLCRRCGTKGGTDELVLTLALAGQAIFNAVTRDPSMLKQMGLPAGVHARMDHGYLVLWGPDSTSGGQAS